MNQGNVQSWLKASIVDLNAQLQLHSFYYFLRSPHQVSGIIQQLPKEFPTPEGQAFNHEIELRWKRKGDRYDLLWLGTKKAPSDFAPITGDWVYEDRDALLYPNTETKLPKEVKYPQALDIGQRYFCDRRTGIIHFTALMVK